MPAPDIIILFIIFILLHCIIFIIVSIFRQRQRAFSRHYFYYYADFAYYADGAVIFIFITWRAIYFSPRSRFSRHAAIIIAAFFIAIFIFIFISPLSRHYAITFSFSRRHACAITPYT